MGVALRGFACVCVCVNIVELGGDSRIKLKMSSTGGLNAQPTHMLHLGLQTVWSAKGALLKPQTLP